MTEAEIDDLYECSQMFDFQGFLPEDDKRLVTEVRRLREALENYGRHTDGCVIQWQNECDCGLWKALNI